MPTKKPATAPKRTKKPKLVVVRTVHAGVHIGELKRLVASEQRVELANARRLWRWRGANTLHEVAGAGVSTDYTRISEPVPSITILGVIEVIPVGPAAAASLTTSRWAP